MISFMVRSNAPKGKIIMKNNTYQMAPMSLNATTRFINNGGKKRLSEQTGKINRFLMVLVIGGLGYGAFIAKNKGLILTIKQRTLSAVCLTGSQANHTVTIMATQDMACN